MNEIVSHPFFRFDHTEKTMGETSVCEREKDKNKSNKKETSKYFPTTIIFLTSKKKIEFHAHTTRSVRRFFFVSRFMLFALVAPIACLRFLFIFTLTLSLSLSLYVRVFYSFVRCYFDAINRILFTMCSNRKMFSNKFMAVFVRFHGPFTYFFFICSFV